MSWSSGGPSNGPDTFTGNAGGNAPAGAKNGNDSLVGGDGNDSLRGEGDNDTISGGDDKDTLIGGNGSDWLFGDDGNDRLVGDGQKGGFDFSSPDTMSGGDGNDTIIGASGDDSILGGSGDDSIRAGAGNDTVEGGAGADTMTSGWGADELSYASDTAGVTVNLLNGTASGGDAEGDSIRPNDFENLRGGSGNDDLTGGSNANNVLWGGDGDDTINTSYGDTAFGEAGNDLLNGSAGNNGIDFLDGGTGDDTIIGNGDLDTLVGGDGNDSIVGGSDADAISGGDGNDTVVGGEGADTIDLGAGDDSYSWKTGDGDDTIYLGGGNDTLNLNGWNAGPGNPWTVTPGTGSDPASFTGTMALGTGGDPTIFTNDSLGTELTVFGYTQGADVITCFAEGTRIATVRGEIMVQDLRVGDLVVAAHGGAPLQPLVWVGHTKVNVARQRDRSKAAPILIKAGALAVDVPFRDLRVSPEHAIFIDGRLVPARLLVNGSSIVQEMWVSEVTYFHIELESHGLVVSDGAVTETYFDDGNRHLFDNAKVAALAVDFEAKRGNGSYAAAACAPLVTEGSPQLASIRSRIDALADQAPRFASVVC